MQAPQDQRGHAEDQRRACRGNDTETRPPSDRIAGRKEKRAHDEQHGRGQAETGATDIEARAQAALKGKNGARKIFARAWLTMKSSKGKIQLTGQSRSTKAQAPMYDLKV